MTEWTFLKTKYSLEGRFYHNVESLGTSWNGINAIAKASSGEGAAYLFGLPLDKESGNITSHALFVPLILRMAETARNASLRAITLGTESGIEFRHISTENASYRVADANGENSIIPEARNSGGLLKLMWGNDLYTEGNYNVVENEDTIAVFGLNASRIESDQTTFDIPNFEEELKKGGWDGIAKVVKTSGGDLGELVTKIETGIHLWWYLVLTVIVIGGETILQKRWKTTS